MLEAALPVPSTPRSTESSRWTIRRDSVRCRNPSPPQPCVTPARAQRTTGRQLAAGIMPYDLGTLKLLTDSNTEPWHSPLTAAEIAPDSLHDRLRVSQVIARGPLIHSVRL